MNKTEAAKLLAMIMVAYPSAYRDKDDKFQKATVNMWQSTFPDIPFEVMVMAFDHFRRVSKFAPTVADMYEELKGVYYQALEEVMTSDNPQTRETAKRIMSFTSQFQYGTDGGYSISSHLPKLKTLPERIDDNGG